MESRRRQRSPNGASSRRPRRRPERMNGGPTMFVAGAESRVHGCCSTTAARNLRDRGAVKTYTHTHGGKSGVCKSEGRGRGAGGGEAGEGAEGAAEGKGFCDGE